MRIAANLRMCCRRRRGRIIRDPEHRAHGSGDGIESHSLAAGSVIGYTRSPGDHDSGGPLRRGGIDGDSGATIPGGEGSTAAAERVRGRGLTKKFSY